MLAGSCLRARGAVVARFLSMARPFWLAWLWLRAVSGQRRPLRSDLLPQIFSIQPRGGPVIGGTQITITGQDLNSASMQCVFGDPRNGEDLSKSSCKYDTTAPQAVQGHYCLCLAPAADYRFGEFVSGASELQVALHVHCMQTTCTQHTYMHMPTWRAATSWWRTWRRSRVPRA